MWHWLTVFLLGLLAALALEVQGYASESRLGDIVLSDLTTTSVCYRYYCDTKSNLIQYRYPCRFIKSGQVALEFGEGAWDTVSGLASAVWHIDQTAAGIWNAVTHPLQTLDVLSVALAGYADAALGGDPRAIGRGVFELAAMAVPVTKAKYVDAVGDVGRVALRGTQGPVIIGETMARVEAAAAKYPGAKILNDMPDFRAMGMTDYEVTGAMMKYNRQWLLEQMRSGRQIIDIGPDPNRAVPSIFYQMEQNMLKNYQKLHPEFNTVVRP